MSETDASATIGPEAVASWLTAPLGQPGRKMGHATRLILHR